MYVGEGAAGIREMEMNHYARAPCHSSSIAHRRHWRAHCNGTGRRMMATNNIAHLSDSLNLITQNLAVSLGTSLAKSLSTFTTARHDAERILRGQKMG